MKVVFFFRRVAGRLAREWRGVQRDPVNRPTERDIERSALILGFTAGACAMAVASMFVVTYVLQQSCG
jgi:hypothetical protein